MSADSPQSSKKPATHTGSSFLIENLLKSSQACQTIEPTDKTDTKDGGSSQDGQTRSRKHRTTFTDTQLYRLEMEFATTKYLSLAERQRIAQMLDMTDVQVKTWFQNRRMKFKRQHSERYRQQVTPTLWKNDNFYRRLGSSSIPLERMYRIHNSQTRMSSRYPYNTNVLVGLRRSSHSQPFCRSLPHQPSNLMTTRV